MKHKTSQKKKIIKARAKVMKLTIRKQQKKLIKPKASSLKKPGKFIKLYPDLQRKKREDTNYQ